MAKAKALLTRMSYTYRYQKALERYIVKVEKYSAKSETEIKMLYIEAVARYEYNKLKFIAFIGMLLVFTAASFSKLASKVKLLTALLVNPNLSEAQNAYLITTAVLYAIALVVLAVVTIDVFFQTKEIIREKVFLEEFNKYLEK